eukprot:g1256.t1
MFKARKKDIRRRPVSKSKTAESSDEDAGNISDASVGTAPPPPAAASTTEGEGQRPKKMRKKSKGKAEKGVKPVLSFGHEDEEESGIGVGKAGGKGSSVFRVKKTKASKAMAKAAKEKTEFTVTPQNDTAKGSWHTATAGMYTKEGLAELRSSQSFTPKPSGGRSRERMTRGGGGGGGGGGNAGTSAADSEQVFAGDEAEMVHEAGQQGDLKEDLNKDDISRLKGRRDALLASRETLGKGADGGGGDDFIPLDGKVPVPGSRKSSAGGANGNDSGAPEDDEEQQRWEEEQVRRGATRPAAKPKPAVPPTSPWGGGAAISTMNGGGGTGGAGWGGVGAGERPKFLGINEMQKALREAGTQLRETHERNERQLQVLVSELATQAAEEEKLSSQQAEVAERFGFFQKTRNALSDLCGMLREKESMLSEVEAAKRLLHARRLERTINVRLEDQEDEILDAREAGAAVTGLGPYRACPGGPLSKSPRISVNPGVENGAGAGADGDRARRRADRQRRRKRLFVGEGHGRGVEGEGWVGSKSFPWGKKERAEVWQALGSEGEESEGEGARDEERSNRVLEAADMVMEDVDDSVKSVSAVKTLFEDWKRRHGEQYAQAYCTLTLPDLLAPFVRLELVRWDPLTGKVHGVDEDDVDGMKKPTTSSSSAMAVDGGSGKSADGQAPGAEAGAGAGGDETDEGEDDLEGVLERFEWYRRLFDFSGDIPPPESAGYGPDEDPDQNLVPQLVEKVALPLVAERLSTAYDAMSRRQTACLVSAVSEILVYDPAEESLKTLLGAAREAFQVAVRNLCVPVIGTCVTSSGRAAAIRLVRLQASRGLKLLRNCLAWRDLLSPESLVPLALGDLVAKRLVPALRELAARGKDSTAEGGGAVGASKKGAGAGAGAREALALCERAVELLPLDWMERPDASAPLASVRITVRLFGDGLGVGGGGGAVSAAAVPTVERVVRLQVALGDEAAARDLARRHAGDELLAVVVPAHRGDLDLAVHSVANWPVPASCSALTERNVDLVLYYAGGEEDKDAVAAAADSIAKTGGRCFANTRTVFAELETKDDVYPKAPSVMFYKMFLDEDVRPHLVEYDALAIIEWDVLVATDRSFEELYHSAFRVNEEFWMKGSNLEGTTFHSSADMAGMWQVLGHINGNAIYNNNDPAFVEYVEYTRTRWEFDYPYDVALWLTISDFPYSWPLYQRYSNKFVTTNLIAYVGHEVVDHSSVSDAIAGQTLFIHGKGVDGGSRASVEAVRAEKGLSPRRNLQNLREGSRRLQQTGGSGNDDDGCEDDCDFTGATTGRVCDASCEDGDPWGTLGCPVGAVYGDLGYSVTDYGDNCRVCFTDEDTALEYDTADDRAIMCDDLLPVTVYYMGGGRRLSTAQQDVPRVSRMLEKLSEVAVEDPSVAVVQGQVSTDKNEAASFFAEAAELPFTDDVARGNMCAFIAGRAGDADLAKVTVMSILTFNPGMRVAVAAEDAGLADYESAVGNLPGVTVSGTSDVITASLFADEYCGADTSLVLYLKVGSVVTRSFTAKDTHSPEGDVLVVYSGARGGYQKDELARKTELVLGSAAPSFTKGTDLILPVSANQDLRELVLSPEETGTGRELVEAMHHVTDLDDVFAVPQVMASLAYSNNTPGMWFVNPQEWVAQNLFKAASIWEIPLLKPRYTCTIDPSLQRSEMPHAVLVAGLQSNLDFFAKGGTCESGVIDIEIHQQM